MTACPGSPRDAVGAALQQHLGHLLVNDGKPVILPDRGNVAHICQLLLNLLFPGFFAARPADDAPAGAALAQLEKELCKQVALALRFSASVQGEAAAGCTAQARAVTDELLGDLAAVGRLVASDVEAAFANDPAADRRETIVLSYPCIEALAVQRFAHCLYRRGVPLIPRMLTEVVHGRTGIDIHPGATIGEHFFIDHGTGVVVGETCVIGAHCVLYQGVTLGAWNPTAKDPDGELRRGQANKRHPDLQDHVTVYAGATILGGETVIGHHSVIGGKVWLTQSVAPHSVVMVEEPKLTIRTRGKGRAPA